MATRLRRLDPGQLARPSRREPASRRLQSGLRPGAARRQVRLWERVLQTLHMEGPHRRCSASACSRWHRARHQRASISKKPKAHPHRPSLRAGSEPLRRSGGYRALAPCHCWCGSWRRWASSCPDQARCRTLCGDGATRSWRSYRFSADLLSARRVPLTVQPKPWSKSAGALSGEMAREWQQCEATCSSSSTWGCRGSRPDEAGRNGLAEGWACAGRPPTDCCGHRAQALGETLATFDEPADALPAEIIATGGRATERMSLL